MEKKMIGAIIGLVYATVVLAGIIGHFANVLATYESEQQDVVTNSEYPSVVTNNGGIQFQMAAGYEVLHCTAIAAQAAMEHQGYRVSAAEIAAATCIPGSDCDKLGRYMHNTADIALEQAGNDNMQRNLSHATTIEDLVSEMVASQATAAIVSVDVPRYYHAVAVVIEADGSWRVIDAAMTTTLLYGGQNYAKINAWEGQLRRGQNWYFTSTPQM